MADKAMRHNSGKAKYSMIDLTCLEDCAKVLEFGAKKYARDNWKKGLPISEILDSLLRHISAIERGELIDPESGLSHLGHIQCNALFLGNPNNTIDIEENNLLGGIDKAEIERIESGIKLPEPFTTKSAPVSMEEYDAFVYATSAKSEPNDNLNRLIKRIKESADYYIGFGVCGHSIASKKKPDDIT